MTTARDWFADEHEFRQLCGDAQASAQGERAQEFAAEIVVRAGQLGLSLPLSARQLEWLCKLADWVAPRRRTDFTPTPVSSCEHATTHPRDPRDPPHHLRCDVIDAEGARCIKGAHHSDTCVFERGAQNAEA